MSVYAQKIDSIKILYESHEKMKEKLQETNIYIAEAKVTIQSYKDMHNWFMTALSAVIALFTIVLIYNQIDLRSRLAGFEREKKEVLLEASNELKQKSAEELQKITQKYEEATSAVESILSLQNSMSSLTLPNNESTNEG